MTKSTVKTNQETSNVAPEKQVIYSGPCVIQNFGESLDAMNSITKDITVSFDGKNYFWNNLKVGKHPMSFTYQAGISGQQHQVLVPKKK